MTEFQPKIAAFLCNWCAYAGADLAGVSRIQYPSNLRTVRVMCSGRVDPLFIIRALQEGYDGVLVAGWHMGDCHYLEGNTNAETKMRMIRSLLEVSGIGRDRLHFELISSSEANRFKEIAETVTASVKSAGPIDRENGKRTLEAVLHTVTAKDVRWLTGKQTGIVANGDVYGRQWSRDQYETVLDSATLREYHNNLICLAIRDGFMSVREIRQATGLELMRISYLLADLERTGRVMFSKMDEKKPVFSVV